MLVSKKADENKLGERRMLKPLTLSHLVNCLGELKRQGYFYCREDVLSTEGPYITMGKDRELLHLAPEWNTEEMKEKKVTSIWIEFHHIIAGESKYLFLREEVFEDELQTVLWMGDDFASACNGTGRYTYVKGMPVVFEEIMHRCEMILVPGQFYKLNFNCFRNQMKNSLFSLLYENEYNQVQGGYMEIKDKKESESGFAWAGEFACGYEYRKPLKYMELAIYYRHFEEYECGYDGKMYRVWEEETADIYVAWREEKLTQSGPENEDKIMLKETEIIKLDEYLNGYRRLDSILESVGQK